MSAKTFLALAAGVVALIASLAGFARFVGSLDTKARADSVYSTKIDMTIHQQGEMSVRERDSLIYDARWSRQDDKLDLLIRDCKRRGGCQ